MPLESLRPDARPKIQNLSTEAPEKGKDIFDPEEEIPEFIRTKILQSLKERPHESWNDIQANSWSEIAKYYKNLFPHDKIQLNYENEICEKWMERFNENSKINNWDLALKVAIRIKLFYPEQYNNLNWPENSNQLINDRIKLEANGQDWEGMMKLISDTKLLNLDCHQEANSIVRDNWDNIKQFLINITSPKSVWGISAKAQIFETCRIALPENYEEIRPITKQILIDLKSDFPKFIKDKNSISKYETIIKAAYLITFLSADEIKISSQGPIISINEDDQAKNQVPPPPEKKHY